MEKKVLIIDFDPQSSLTVCFGYENTDNISTTIYNLMALAIEEKNLPKREEYVISVGNIDIIPCSLELSAIEILITMYTERMKISKEILSITQEAYGGRINIFENKIPNSVRVGEANMKSKSIIEYDSKNKVSIAYREFAKEVTAL